MIGVTADSNIYISGFVFAGQPLQFLDAARAGRFQLSLSDVLLDALPLRLEKFTRRVHPAIPLDVAQSDPDDSERPDVLRP